MGLFSALKKGLEKTRNGLKDGIGSLFHSYEAVSDDFYEELEEALILADMGMETAMQITETLRQKAKEQRLESTQDVYELFKEEINRILEAKDPRIVEPGKTNVILVIGVNGAGKTTSIGKMAYQLKQNGHHVILAAADTFRAAAIDQLKVWAERAGVEIVCHEEGSDPGAVVYDAADITHSRWADVLICDTAGRLHNKKNLMEELKKIGRILEREFPTAHREVLLVLDAATGQNALSQARLFAETAPITGIILTKLDGTAKGGVVVGIMNELGIPVKYVGVGEGMEDLKPFDAREFAEALFSLEQEEETEETEE